MDLHSRQCCGYGYSPAEPRLRCGRAIMSMCPAHQHSISVSAAECHDACQSQLTNVRVPTAYCPCHSLIKYSKFGRKSEQKYLKVYLSHCFVIRDAWCALCILQMVHLCNVKWVKIIGFCHQQCFFSFPFHILFGMYLCVENYPESFFCLLDWMMRQIFNFMQMR